MFSKLRASLQERYIEIYADHCLFSCLSFELSLEFYLQPNLSNGFLDHVRGISIPHPWETVNLESILAFMSSCGQVRLWFCHAR